MPGLEDRSRADVGLRRKAVTLASILVFIALVVGSVFGDRGVIHVLAQRQEAAELRGQVAGLRADNVRLASQIHALKTDPKAIEHIAREELSLARPGETVFVIRPQP